jgi:DNA-binding NarL/FixJ family response regulator
MSQAGPSQRPLRILIVDDHAVFRRGLREVLEEEHDIRVVDEAADGEEAIRLAMELSTARLDLVLMDLEMPKLDGITAASQIIASVPGLKVIMLTASNEDQDLYRAAASGVAGFLTKNLSAQAMVKALRDYVNVGALPMSRTMAAKALTFLQQQARAASRQAPVTDQSSRSSLKQPSEASLTPRETDVAKLMAAGLRDREIAERLTISHHTAREYSQRVLRKLGARTRAEAGARFRERFN